MKREHSMRLSNSDEAQQREIARRLRLGLPLAGMLVAAALGCGCERSTYTVGDVPRTDAELEAEASESKSSGNRKNESRAHIRGKMLLEKESGAKEQCRDSNGKNEKKDAPVILGAPAPAEK